MLTTSGPGGLPPAPVSKSYPVNVEHSAPAQQPQRAKYDSVELSPAPDGERRFYLDLIGRLSREVRTAVTTSEVQAIGAQVHSGAYEPDPMSIASRMLLWEGAE